MRVFDPKRFKNGVIGDFLECLNINLDESIVKSFKSANISPNTKIIKIMQFLNKIATQGLHKSRNECRKLYLNPLLRDVSKNGRIAKTISKIPDWLISNELLSEEVRLEISKEFEESNQKIAQDYLGRQDGKLFNSI